MRSLLCGGQDAPDRQGPALWPRLDGARASRSHVFRWLTRRVVALAGSAALLVAIGGGAARPVAAECDGPAASFREVATTGTRVVIGDVVAVDPAGALIDDLGRSSRFTLQVRYVLRGTADATIAITDLASGPCAGPIEARTGDRLAIAFDVMSPLWPNPANAAAWIVGTPPPEFEGFEQITVAEVFRLLDLQVPATSTAPPSASVPPVIAVSAGLVALLWGLVFIGRRRRPGRMR